MAICSADGCYRTEPCGFACRDNGNFNKETVTDKVTSSKKELLDNLVSRKIACWAMAKVFLENEDAHGIHDMGVEIQALDRAIDEIKKIDF